MLTKIYPLKRKLITMSWISNIFKRKENTSTNGKSVKKKVAINKKPINLIDSKSIEAAKKVQLVSFGGELEPAIVIANKIPAYYKNIHIILDNGHGEETPGKRSPDGKFREYRFNRVIVGMIADELEKLGISYSILVPETCDISLKERVIRANKIHQEQHSKGKTVILISVHANAAGGSGWSNATGWSGWTTRGTTESDTLAACLYQAAHEVLDPKGMKIRKDMTDGDEDYEENFYIIYKSSMPSVLTENFFMTTKSDVAYLDSEEGKRDITDIHVKGIQKYIELKFNK